MIYSTRGNREMTGDGGTPEGGLASDPLNRGLFRESALAHHARWGNEPGAGARPTASGFGGRPARATVLLLVVCVLVLAGFGWLVRVPATVPVPAEVTTSLRCCRLIWLRGSGKGSRCGLLFRAARRWCLWSYAAMGGC